MDILTTHQKQILIDYLVCGLNSRLRSIKRGTSHYTLDDYKQDLKTLSIILDRLDMQDYMKFDKEIFNNKTTSVQGV